jgi:hypothetical protein
MEISLKNTKAEIMAAYQEQRQNCLQQQETILRLETEAETTPNPSLKEEGEMKKVSVVIPYVKKYAQGNELKLAVRGWDTHFREEFNLVIVGDREPWMNDRLNVIECAVVGSNPPIDIAHKMLRVIESDLVSEKFIWSNDDQYLVSPVMLADLEFLKCTGKLTEKNLGGSLYHENKRATYTALKSMGAGTWDFSVHMPFVFEKEKLRELIETMKLTEKSMLIATLYYNIWFPGFVPYNVETQIALENDNLKAGVYRPNADLDRLRALIPRKKVVGNSQAGYSEKLMKIIADILPNKCRFEK